MSAIIINEYSAPSINRREIYRYMQAKQSEDLDALIDRGLALVLDKLSYKVCYTELAINESNGMLDLGFAVTDSRDLAKCLDGCESIILFAATVGIDLDRLILRYSKLEPSMALCLQAIGSERAEALCDAFCDDMASKYAADGKILRPRFSAGYGDLPLSLQADIIATLQTPKNIGVSLNQSLLMSPSKSVPAIIGIKGTK